MTTDMTKEKFTFQTEVSKLLNIVAHSLYSHQEIFLRELLSNASDACERRRYAALSGQGKEGAESGRVVLSIDEKAGTLSIADNGIGMNREDLIDSLGTIARSGTQAFVEALSKEDDNNLTAIGQFGVGFYSAFMVAKKVTALTRKAGEDEAWLWTSDGKGEFTVAGAKKDSPGTTVTLTMNKDGKEFLDKSRIEQIVRTHSDHISIPILFADDEDTQTINSASALWTRPKGEITQENYKEFYHHVGHGFDEPWMTIHNNVEGVISYTNLLFIPSMPPMDLFHPERKQQVKLYVKRVFITDHCDELLPSWLRFVRGIVDSEDLSLNISREMLQQDPKMAKIRSGLIKRVLGELAKKRKSDQPGYDNFWKNFGAVIKEGLYEDFQNREKILDICQFRSTTAEGYTTLDAYVERMVEGQEAIYYILGADEDQITKSPQLEGFQSRGIEVLLLSDPVDEFWIGSLGTFKETPFKSVTRGSDDLEKIKGDKSKEKADKKADHKGMDTLLSALKTVLDGSVKDVRSSSRLTDSPVCLVAGEGDMDMELERMLKRHGQLKDGMESLRIFEVNPDHSLIRKMVDLVGEKGPEESQKDPQLVDCAHLLLDQARIFEGEPVSDPEAFAHRLNAIMEKGFN